MTKNDKFRAVLFDLGGTLVTTAPPPEIIRRVLEAHGVKVSLDEVAAAHRENEKDSDIEKMIVLGTAFWPEWNLRIVDRLGVKKDRMLLARRIDELFWEYADLRVFPDVIETLVQLRAKGVKLGIITNGLKKDYEQILGKLDMSEFFDVVVGVDSCGSAKPDKKVFLHAVNRLHVQPKEALFIGDSAKYDFEGAKGAGLKPLLINRGKDGLTEFETIGSLTEVLTLT